MATIYILIGLPASGKSTWRANHIAKNPDIEFVTCSTDDLIEEFAAKECISYDEAFKRVNFKDLQAKFRQRFREAVNNGKNIIVDRTNMNQKSRKEFLKNLPEGYETVGVVFVVSEPELKRRLAERAAATGKSIPEDVIKDMAARYSPPAPGEFTRVERVIFK